MLADLGIEAGSGARYTFPVTAVGYASVAERLALHVGLGYAPYTRFTARDVPTRTDATVTRALVGADFLLARRSGVHFTWSTELDTLLQLGALGDYRSTALTTSLGILF